MDRKDRKSLTAETSATSRQLAATSRIRMPLLFPNRIFTRFSLQKKKWTENHLLRKVP